VLQMLLASCLTSGRAYGLRVAEPGEFTRRAYLNEKLDLAQAEAVADLIEASTETAARSALASMTGSFSSAVNALVQALIRLRLLVEATLDFPEEEVDFLRTSDAAGQLQRIQSDLQSVFESTRQGALLREGLTVVLAGRPNVGKSSLLNALAQAEVAIVTPIAGTTRDRVIEAIQIQGVALHLVDTAGLRLATDPIEQIGIERTWREIERADIILNLRDATDPETPDDAQIVARLPASIPRRVVINKIDLTGDEARLEGDRIYLSAQTGAGLELLRGEILDLAGWSASAETLYLGRARHLEALANARTHLAAAVYHAEQSDRALELFAEELRLAQDQLSRITGAFTSDDLLGEIFGRFCIGK
jgi:tRNA modification GTPase